MAQTVERFFKQVTIHPATGGWAIYLDGRPVKTPAGHMMCVPDEKLAEEVRMEWDAQDRDIDPQTMPLTQVITTAQDKVAGREAEIRNALMKYFDTDLICYYVHEPEDLSAQQINAWGPAHDWFEGLFGHPLKTTTSLSALKQDAQLHEMTARWLQGCDLWRLTLVQLAASESGSVILGMAFGAGAIDANQLYRAAFVDELFRAQLAGEDEYGADPQRAARDADFMRLMRAAEHLRERLPQSR